MCASRFIHFIFALRVLVLALAEEGLCGAASSSCEAEYHEAGADDHSLLQLRGRESSYKESQAASDTELAQQPNDKHCGKGKWWKKGCHGSRRRRRGGDNDNDNDGSGGGNWCMEGWKAETTNYPADPARSEWCRDSGDLACTPFSFLIHYDKAAGAGCGGGAPVTGQGATAPLSQGKWQAAGDDYMWIFHTCDGSGVQANDCNGANSWFVERVWPTTQDYHCHPWNDETEVTDEKCTWDPADYSKCQHNVCTHWHAGTGETASKYQCGWWGEGKYQSVRTDDGWWEQHEGWNGQGYVHDINGDGTWWGYVVHVYNWVCHSQSKCDPAASATKCKGWAPDQTALDQEPAGSADAPYDSFPGGYNAAFTGDEDLRCFCDNEPFGYDTEGEKYAAPGASLFIFKFYCPGGDFDTCNVDTMYLQQVRGPGTCATPSDCEQELHRV